MAIEMFVPGHEREGREERRRLFEEIALMRDCPDIGHVSLAYKSNTLARKIADASQRGDGVSRFVDRAMNINGEKSVEVRLFMDVNGWHVRLRQRGSNPFNVYLKPNWAVDYSQRFHILEKTLTRKKVEGKIVDGEPEPLGIWPALPAGLLKIISADLKDHQRGQ